MSFRTLFQSLSFLLHPIHDRAILALNISLFAYSKFFRVIPKSPTILTFAFLAVLPFTSCMLRGSHWKIEVALTTSAANDLSVSYISSEGGASCSSVGIDESETIVVGANTVPVGPLQTQISASCLAL